MTPSLRTAALTFSVLKMNFPVQFKEYKHSFNLVFLAHMILKPKYGTEKVLNVHNLDQSSSSGSLDILVVEAEKTVS